MVVLDVDPDHGGLKTLADLEEIHGVLPETSTVRTGGSGGEIRRVRGASIGTRNVTLNRTAFALGQLVGAGHLCEEAARAALLDAATQTGLTVAEARATIASGIRAGSRFPRFPRNTRAPGIAAEV